ncbi:Sec-independent protein translocase subunit TatA [Streptomyces sp. FXJ1.172]|nr:Sec-independent protein translocase subunit TatA [Streptomyces sp. FXJ1.172]WEO94673.1 Sec-independent protein translocase subunit TatA [Streptomyces sp. FXJ1.172]
MFRNGLEPWHLLLVAIAIILLFGPKKLPETARALGKSLRILKSEAKAMKEEGAAPPSSAPTEDAAAEPKLRVIQTAPGQTETARPVTENRAAR